MTRPVARSSEEVPCPAGCGHPLRVHSADRGCWQCDCRHGRVRGMPIPLGAIHVTPGAAEALAAAGIDRAALLDRHRLGDWGDIDPGEGDDNDQAVNRGALLHSIYQLPTGAEVWVITEGDRTGTVIITPDEY